MPSSWRTRTASPSGDAGLLRRWRGRRSPPPGPRRQRGRSAAPGRSGSQGRRGARLVRARSGRPAGPCDVRSPARSLSTIEAILRREPAEAAIDEAPVAGIGSSTADARGRPAALRGASCRDREVSLARPSSAARSVRAARPRWLRAAAPSPLRRRPPIDHSEPLLTAEELDAFFSPLEEPRSRADAPHRDRARPGGGGRSRSGHRRAGRDRRAPRVGGGARVEHRS